MSLQRIHIFLFLTFAVLATSCSPSDNDIQQEIYTRLQDHPDLSGVAATVQGGVVTLSGSVATEAEKNSVEAIARQVHGVDSVRNEVTVGADSISTGVVNPVPPAGSGLLADQIIMDSAKVIGADFPGVNISVADGIITITGSANEGEKTKLLERLRALNPKSINDQIGASGTGITDTL